MKASDITKGFYKAYKQYTDELNSLQKTSIGFIDENSMFVELYNYGLKVGWSDYICNPDPEYRYGYGSLNIPEEDKEKAIKYLESKFPEVNSKIISNIVEKHLIK